MQVSFLGPHNSELCATFAKLDRNRCTGVAVLASDIDDTKT